MGEEKKDKKPRKRPYLKPMLVAYTALLGTALEKTGGLAGGTTTSTSDISLKKDVQNLGQGTKILASLGALRGVYYFWNEKYLKLNPQSDKRRQLGLIAQDLEEHYPELVSRKDGFLTVDYSRFSVVLLEAIKQLIEENKMTRARVSALEAMILANPPQPRGRPVDGLDLAENVAQKRKAKATRIRGNFSSISR